MPNELTSEGSEEDDHPQREAVNQPSRHIWPGFELRFAEDELASEFPNVSLMIINMVVGLAKTGLSPLDGRGRLLEECRKVLGRDDSY